MNDLTTGAGISEALKRRYGIVDERPVQTLATDLFPMVNVQDGVIPDLAFVGGVRICAAFGLGAATAAEYSGVVLRNPTGSGCIAVVRQITLNSAQAGVIRLNFDDPGTVGTLLGVGAVAIIDTRSGSSSTVHQLPSLEFRTHHTATPVGVGIAQTLVTSVVDGLPMILMPGTAIWVFGGTLNTNHGVSIVWQERNLNAWENFRTL